MDDNPYASSKAPLDASDTTPENAVISSARKSLALFAAFVGGALIWAFSPALIGHVEPWDGNNGYYLLSISLISVISGLISGGKLWPPVIGVYLGQVAYCACFYRPGGYFPLMLISVGIIGGIPSTIGAVTSWLFLRSIKRR